MPPQPTNPMPTLSLAAMAAAFDPAAKAMGARLLKARRDRSDINVSFGSQHTMTPRPAQLSTALPVYCATFSTHIG
jgi:hypothetical protein